jgi:hypothetical protein
MEQSPSTLYPKIASVLTTPSLSTTDSNARSASFSTPPLSSSPSVSTIFHQGSKSPKLKVGVSQQALIQELTAAAVNHHPKLPISLMEEIRMVPDHSKIVPQVKVLGATADRLGQAHQDFLSKGGEEVREEEWLDS